MYKIIEPVIKMVKINHFTTSDFFFIFNCKFSCVMFIFFGILLTTMDLLRTSIDCYVDMAANGRKSIMDNFCWSVGTYTCENVSSGNCLEPIEDNKVYHRYYQWMWLIFLSQAAIMYMPAYLWSIFERGFMHRICNDLGMITEFQWKRNIYKNLFHCP